MGTIIDLKKYRDNRKNKDIELVQDIKNSLDNNIVMQRYNIAPKLTEQERMDKIRESIKRVNRLMAELEDSTTKNEVK